MTKKAFEELQIKDDFMFCVIMRNSELGLGDAATKIILSIKGTMDDVASEMKKQQCIQGLLWSRRLNCKRDYNWRNLIISANKKVDK